MYMYMYIYMKLNLILQEYERQVQVLIQQLAEANTPSPSEVALTSSSKEEGEGDRDNERIQALESKINLLEKDLFYYKKTSRELKKRLQQSQSQISGSDASSKGQRREEGGLRERKNKSAHGGSTEHGCDRDTMSDGVTDSLEVRSISDKNLTVSGTSVIAGTKGQERHATTHSAVIVASTSADRVSQAPPIIPPTGEAQQQQVVRKQKKQLRQLR